MPDQIKNPSIKYTSREFNSIRDDLIKYAKRYYPDSYRDFNEASFGSLMVDAVSYIGDILSFYLDYQANESFLTTANDYNNILKHGKALGYKLDTVPSSYGVVTLYVNVPAAIVGFGVEADYIPVLRRGTMFSTMAGTSFTLINDVNFADPANQVVVATVDESTGAPTGYAIRAYGEVVSGMYNVKELQVGDFQKFLRIDLEEVNLSEIISVFDSDGNEYFEVDYLSQNIVYRPVLNTGVNSDTVPNLLKPFVVMRRYVVERERGKNFLQFGYGSEKNLSNEGILKPDDIVFERHAREHITDLSFDPTKLLQSDKFGMTPSNTTLTVAYRRNSNDTVNAAAGTVNSVSLPLVKFQNPRAITTTTKNGVIGSIEVTNEQTITGDVTYPSEDEIKRRIFDVFTSQHRAVTEQDYKALIYMMPAKFGALKRCKIVQDPDAFKRNLNIYVVSENSAGNLIKTNDVIKGNLKNWLNQYRMMNDTIDIVDARVVNIGVQFTIVASVEEDKYSVLQTAESALRNYFLSIGEISEPINISNIYQTLNSIPGVSDTVDVTLVRKTGPDYSPIDFNVVDSTSFDGRYLIAPEDVVFEIKFLTTDVGGSVR